MAGDKYFLRSPELDQLELDLIEALDTLLTNNPNLTREDIQKAMLERYQTWGIGLGGQVNFGKEE